MDLNDLDSRRKRSIQDVLARREEFLARRKLALELINAGYRALSVKLHPDRGGTQEAMSRLSDARKLLRDMVGRHVR